MPHLRIIITLPRPPAAIIITYTRRRKTAAKQNGGGGKNTPTSRRRASKSRIETSLNPAGKSPLFRSLLTAASGEFKLPVV
jgi:hypothetical protein